MILRWIVLLVTLANIAFNALYAKLLDLPAINLISNKYFNLFTPAGYTFSIWGVIYLSFIIYAIIQVFPAHNDKKTFDRLAIPFILISLLSSTWIVAFTSEKMLLSVGILVSTLIVAITAFLIAKQELKANANLSRWLLVPFSLFAGWISVAIIANVSAYLVSTGWYGGSLGQVNWTLIMIIAAATIGVAFSLSQKNAIYPLVTAWALNGIYNARSDDHPIIATTALSAAAVMVIVSAIVLVKSKNGYPEQKL